MQPSIICLTGHAGFLTIPPLREFFAGAEIDTPQCLILDLRTVRYMETCTAQFLAETVSKLALQETPGLLVVVGPKNRPNVLTSLRRGGLDLREQKGDGSAAALQSRAPATSTQLSCLLCNSLEQAIAVSRNRTWEKPSALPIVLRPIGPRSDDVPNESLEEIVDKLLSYIPVSGSMSEAEPAMSTYEIMKCAGLVIREVRQGDAISCPRYPVQPVFMVLIGLVVLRNSHEDLPKLPLQLSVREAVQLRVRTALSDFGKQLRRISKRKDHGAHEDAESRYLVPFDWFDESQATSSCAHASGHSCWILDIDPKNQVGIRAARQLGRRSKMAKY